MTSLYDFSAETIQGNPVSLSDYAGRMILFVNTASKCGFTPQFAELEKLYETYQSQGFVILGFPCNQFLWQDPGTNADILSFCQLNYGVTFPMFAKIAVKGRHQHPLFAFLVEQSGGKKIGWNFTKFLFDRDGHFIARYEPKTAPKDIEPMIQDILNKQ